MSIARKIGNVADVLDSAATGDFFAKGSSDGQFQNIAYSSVVGTPGSIDSAATTALIDSAYIQARQTSGGAAGLDSATTINLIDSSYVAARSGGTSGFDIFTYTATAGQTVFQDSSSDGTILNYQENGTLVYYNGLLLANEDYTETSNDVITLAEGADSGAVISIATWDVSGSETWSSVSAAIANSKYTTVLMQSIGSSNSTNSPPTSDATSTHTLSTTGTVKASAYSPYKPGGFGWKYPDTMAQTVPTHTDFAFGTGEFCIEFWWRPDDTSFTAQGGIFDFRNSSGQNSSATLPALLIDDSPAVIHWTGANNNLSYATSNFTPGTWYHIAISRDSSNNLGLFVNGSRVDVETSHTTSYVAPTSNIYIGNWYAISLSNYKNNHSIYDLRIIKGGTGGREGSSFTVPTELLTAVSGTVLLTCRQGYLADESTSGHSPTLQSNSSPASTTVLTQPNVYNRTGYSTSSVGGSYNFNSSGNLIETSARVLPASAYTISCWVIFNDTNASTIYYQGTSGQQTRLGIASGGSWYCQGTNDNTITSSGGSVRPNIWYYTEVQYDGTTMELFVNGTSIGTTTSGDPENYPLHIGATDAGTNDLDGNIADLKVVLGTPSGSSTVPTSPVGSSGASLYLSGTENLGFADISQSANTITINGSTTSSTTQSKFGSTSMYFSGSPDELVTSGANIANFGTGDFTVEAWIYPESLSGYNPIVADDQYVSSTPTNAWCLYLHGSTVDPWKSGSSILDGGTLSTNTWQHIAWTRESGTMRIFIDGSLVDTATDTTSFDHGDIIIGANVGNYHYEGYIEDLRITKGLARYTAAFTPPTSSLQG